MKNLIILFFIFCNYNIIYSQEKIQLFRDLNNYSVYRDIVHADDGIWIFKDDLKNGTSQPLKLNESNEIIANGPTLSLFYDEESRPFAAFLGLDSINNVYLCNALLINNVHSGIKIYKINSKGDVIWEQLLDFQDINELISRSQIFEGALIGVGTLYNFDEDIYKPMAFSISLEDGQINWQKEYPSSGFSSFFDIVITDKKKPVVLQIGLNEEEKYFTKIVDIDFNGNLMNSIEISKADFFGNRLIHLDNDNFLVSGFLDSDAHLINFNVNNQQIEWDKRIFYAWDDGDINIFKINNKILSLHTTFPGGNDSPGSGIELMISLFDLEGNMIDSLFYDYDDKYETNTWNSFKGRDGKIYFCGVESTFLSDEEIYGFWGILNPDSLSVSTYTFKENTNLVFYPNLIEPNSKVYFISDFKVLSIELIDLNGNDIFNNVMNVTSGNIKIPEIPSGLYFVVFKTTNGNQIKKLIIK